MSSETVQKITFKWNKQLNLWKRRIHLHWIVWSQYIEYFFQSIINFTANPFSCWLFSSSSDMYLWRHGVCRWTVQHIHCILNYKVKINHIYLWVMSESLLYEFIEKKIIFFYSFIWWDSDCFTVRVYWLETFFTF